MQTNSSIDKGEYCFIDIIDLNSYLFQISLSLKPYLPGVDIIKEKEEKFVFIIEELFTYSIYSAVRSK